jgi:hypothetical protein
MLLYVVLSKLTQTYTYLILFAFFAYFDHSSEIPSSQMVSKELWPGNCFF